jgi:hypothetical protein
VSEDFASRQRSKTAVEEPHTRISLHKLSKEFSEGARPNSPRQLIQPQFRHRKILAIIRRQRAPLLQCDCGHDRVRQSQRSASSRPLILQSPCMLTRAGRHRMAQQHLQKRRRSTFFFRVHSRIDFGDIESGRLQTVPVSHKFRQPRAPRSSHSQRVNQHRRIQEQPHASIRLSRCSRPHSRAFPGFPRSGAAAPRLALRPQRAYPGGRTLLQLRMLPLLPRRFLTLQESQQLPSPHFLPRCL